MRNISNVLLKPTDELVIKLSVRITDRNNNDIYYTSFKIGSSQYDTIDLKKSIILQYIPPMINGRKKTYDKSRYIHIDETNIFTLIELLHSFYDVLKSKETIFKYYDSGYIEYCYDKENIMKRSLKRGESIELEPTVITEETSSICIPGITMRLNKKDNALNLSIDEFESVLYLFNKINLSTEAMLLLLAHNLVIENKKMPISKANKKDNSYWHNEVDITEDYDYIIDNRNPHQTYYDSLYDINKEKE